MKKSIGVLGIIVVVITVTYSIFRQFFEIDYFRWYLDEGPIISLSLAFITLVWGELDQNTELISANPAIYFSGCFWINSAINSSMATNLRRILAPVTDETPEIPVVRLLWDSFWVLIIYIFLFLLTIAWLILVAPLTYFINLIAGAPARVGLTNTNIKAQVIQIPGVNNKLIREIDEKEDINVDHKAIKSLDVSLARNPVRLTSTIASILIWLIKLGIDLV